MTDMNTEFLPVELASAASALDTSTRKQWVQLFKQGENPARDGRFFTLSDSENVIANTKLNAGSMELPVDYEHQTDLAPKNGQPAPAAGWIEKLEDRSSGLWALVLWTEKAATMISNKEYRYLSPVFTTISGEVKCILRAGLTNNPALELTQLATRKETQKDNDMTFQQRAAETLGLAKDASAEEILAAITSKPAERASNEDGDFEAVQSMMVGLNNERRDIQMARVTEKVSTALKTGAMPPSMKDWLTNLCHRDEAAYDEFIKKVGTPFEHLFHPNPHLEEAQAKLQRARVGNHTDNSIAQQLGISADDMT